MIFGRRVERRSVVGDAIRRRVASVTVTPTESLAHTAVLACVRLISESIASMPWHAYRDRGDERVRVAPQPSWLADPGPTTTGYEFRRDLLVSLLLRGNAWVEVAEVDASGWPARLALVHPDTVTPVVADGVVSWRVDGASLAPVEAGGPILHIPGLRVAGELLGVSPITAAAQAITAGLAAERLGVEWFRADPPQSVIRTERDLSDDAARRLAAKWAAARESGGAFPAVLTGGATWEPVSVRPADVQFLDAQKFSIAQIARVFGVPPHMIGDVERSTSWGSGIEAQSIGFLQHTLLPWITLVDQRFSRLVPRGQYVKTNPSGLLRTDIKSRYEAFMRGRVGGWLTVNEIRALEEMPPLEAMDDPAAPLNTGGQRKE